MKQRFDDKSIGAKRRVAKKKILLDLQRKHFLQNFISKRMHQGTKICAELLGCLGSPLRFFATWGDKRKFRQHAFRTFDGNVVPLKNRE
ncbi:hypothetical protein O3S81_24660 [Agrobacterium sp. SOY23]|uniref:hypothetical protein n=1 Tax=Agrobacterium sp. SOY23 TaxID=3014555 RepID=UPI0022B04D00|nr:hypothetical protein [Agrobacterium sp. SOY23]MCZ4432915.1 hypothetical protein [Agrobacterium sp. SOY23]